MMQLNVLWPALYQKIALLTVLYPVDYSFRHATKDSQYHDLIKEIIAELVSDERRFIQTGIGWVLADLSKPYPEEAEALFRQYLSQLSREVIDRHAKHLNAHKELKMLKREKP